MHVRTVALFLGDIGAASRMVRSHCVVRRQYGMSAKGV